MINNAATKSLLAMALLLTSACATLDAGHLPQDAVLCPEPRPQICTMDYNPVCATRDTTNTCDTLPCPSTETATYSNGCGACADAAVIYFQPGACKE